MRIVYPYRVCRKKRNKRYCRWELQTSVEDPLYRVILDPVEWQHILEMADKYVALIELVKDYYWEKRFSYEFLRDWLVEEMRHLENYAKKLEQSGCVKEAELVRFRIKVYTEELKQRERELERLERILKELGLL